MWSTLGQMADSLNHMKEGAGEQLNRVLERGKQDFAGDEVDDPDDGLYGDESSDSESESDDEEEKQHVCAEFSHGATEQAREEGMGEPAAPSKPTLGTSTEPSDAPLLDSKPSKSSTEMKVDICSSGGESSSSGPILKISGSANPSDSEAAPPTDLSNEKAGAAESSQPTVVSDTEPSIKLPPGMTAVQVIDQYRQRLAKARQYVVGIKAQLKDSHAREAESQQACDHAQAELALREQQMAAISSKMAAAVQQESELRDALTRSNASLDEAKAQAARSEDLEAELEQQKSLAARLKEQGEEKYAEAVDMRSRCRELKQRLEEVEAERDRAAEQLEAQKDRVESLQSRMQALNEKAAGAQEAHHSAKTSAQQALEEAKATAGEAESLKSQRDEARASAAEAAAALEDLRSEAAEARKEAEDSTRLASQATGRVGGLEQQVHALSADLTACKRELSGLQQRLRAEGIQAAQREDELEQQLASARMQLQSSASAATSASNADAGLRTSVVGDESTPVVAASAIPRESDSLLQQLLQLQREVEEVREEGQQRADALRQAARDAEAEALSLREQLEAARQEISKHKEAYQVGAASLEQARRSLASMAADRSSLQQQLHEERARRAEASSEAGSGRRTTEALRQTVRELQLELESEYKARVAVEKAAVAGAGGSSNSAGSSEGSVQRGSAGLDKGHQKLSATRRGLGSASDSEPERLAAMASGVTDSPEFDQDDLDSEEVDESPAMIAFAALSQAISTAVQADDLPMHAAAKIQGLLRPLSSQLQVKLQSARQRTRLLRQLRQRLSKAEEEAEQCKGEASKALAAAAQSQDFRMKHDVLLELMGEREEEVERLRGKLEEQREVLEFQIEELTRRLVEQGGGSAESNSSFTGTMGDKNDKAVDIGSPT